MNERLLTEEELFALLARGELPQVCEAQDSKTLKAVGEWLENKRAGRTMADGKMALIKEIPDENWVCFLTDEDVNALKRGEMPEES